MKARIKDYIRTFDHTSILTLVTDEDIGPLVDELGKCDLAVSVKRYRRARSLNANAYCWTLIGELSARLKTPPDDVYRRLIRDIGGNYEVVPIKKERIGDWERVWCAGHIGRFCEDLGACRVAGYHNIRTYYGSSDYDTAQMSRLIDSVVEECRAVGIETLPAGELNALKMKWT